MVRNPAFAPAEVERLRAQRLAAIASETTQPGRLAARALPPLLYGADSPYGRSFTGTGDEAAVAALTRADLVAFHDAWMRPDKAKIFVVCDLPLAEVTPRSRPRFGDWRAPATRRGPRTSPPPIPAPTSRDRPDRPAAVAAVADLRRRGAAAVGHRRPAGAERGQRRARRTSCRGSTSDLRETKGWSYGVRGSVNPLEHRVPYIVNAPVQADRTGESIAALIAQYDDFLATEGVTPAELERTINGNTRALAGGFETSAPILGALRSNDLYGRPDDYQATLASRTRALTAAQLDAAARAVDRPRQVRLGRRRRRRDGQARSSTPLGLPVEVRSAQ